MCAVVQNPITGRSSGSFAGAIFQKWKNKNVLRSKPIQVNNPNTVAQQMRRGMFGFCVETARLIRPVIEIGFSTFKATETWMNSFIKYNNGELVVAGTAPAFTIEFGDMAVSSGPLTKTLIASIDAADGNATVVVTWDTALAGIDQNASDEPIVLVYNETRDEFGSSIATVLRSAGTVNITMPVDSSTSDSLIAYLFFRSADGSTVSDNTEESHTVA